MEYYNASEFQKYSGSYLDEELIKMFKEAKTNGKKIYLCKKCSAEITTSENGLCDMCEFFIDYDNKNKEIRDELFYGEDIFEYYNRQPNVELINDLKEE